MRRSDEAEGDSRMMGSGRRAGFWLWSARDGFCATLVLPLPPDDGLGFLERSGWASFLTPEKS